jgi:glycerate kinase
VRVDTAAWTGGVVNPRFDALLAKIITTGDTLEAALQRAGRALGELRVVGVSTNAALLANLVAHPDVAAGRVTTRFVDAAPVFGPQKGASPAQVRMLSGRLDRLVQVYRDEFGVDVSDIEGAGAAGGLAGALAALGGKLVPGFDLVADEIDLYDTLATADLVVTGEGFLDKESFDGKVVGGVRDLAREAGVPVVAVVGEAFDGADDEIETISLVDRFGRDRSMTDTVGCISEAVAERVGAG